MEPKPTFIISRISYLGSEIIKMADAFTKAPADEYALGMVKDKLNHLRNSFEKVENLQSDLLSLLTPEQREEHEYFKHNYYKTIQNTYEGLVPLLEDRANLLYKQMDERTFQTSTPQRSHTAAQTQSHAFLRLPTLELTPFDGTYESWQNFHDMFTATVDNNNSLSNAMKLQHLKAALRGEAASILSTLSITDDNYKIAWDTLVERYQNNRALKTYHFNKLANIPPVSQDSLTKLRLMRDTIQVALDSLKLLKCPTDSWGELLVHQMTQKFSLGLRKEWEKSLAGSTEFPSYQTFRQFLANQIHILENIDLHKSSERDENSDKRQRSAMNLTVKTTGQECSYCSKPHAIYRCEAFQQMPITERNQVRKDKQLCNNCLGKGHQQKDCRSKRLCRTCNKKHHSLLHLDFVPEAKGKGKPTKTQPKPSKEKERECGTPEATNITTCHATPSETVVIIATALVRVCAPRGHTAIVRALLDSGAESSFVSESLAQTLRLPKKRTDVIVNGLQGVQTSSPRYATTFDIENARNSSDRKYKVHAYILQKITAYKPKRFKPEDYPELKQLDLADPEPSRGFRIEMLLGADVLGQLMQQGVLHLKNTLIKAQSTALGWILSGPTRTTNVQRSISVAHASTDLSTLLQRFWELEEHPEKATNSPEDELCEKIFVETTTRDDSGRFQVQLPFKSEEAKAQIGESRTIAYASWKRVETRLEKAPALKQQYDDFMEEYIALRHMVEIPATDERADTYNYLPHHAVVREESVTTKLRVVFNASAKTRSGVSLNDTLCTGAKLQNDIAEVITNWRIPKIVFTADITKMFRQIEMQADHQAYQCILWRKSKTSKVKCYKLATVTYGVASAPFAANRVIKALIAAHGHEYPLAVEPLDKCTYVDDVLCGADTEEDAVNVRTQIDALLQRGCLKLRKWASNTPSLLPDQKETSDEFLIEPEGEKEKKVLGIVWNPREDAFSVKVETVDNTQITKRTILSHIARLFDPLGWLSPFVIRAKVIMQSLWIAKIEWDSPEVSVDIKMQWLALTEELQELTELRIPRFVGAGGARAEFHLIGFSDASRGAYSAVVYLYVIYPSGQLQSNLLQAKSRAAPVKTQSIPRLELCGARELTKLITKVRSSWLGTIHSVECYTDSKIVLDWLAKHPSNWQTFVANRVSFIQSNLPDVQWKHISTKRNPADSLLLHPFLDEGLIRVGGRLQHSELPYPQKHPVVLPKSTVTNMLIRYYHVRHLHSGLQLTLSALKHHFWIIHVRNATKRVLSRCVTCTRQRAVTEQQLMSSLPAPRCQQSRAFSHVGLDYAGPFQMKSASGRG